MTNGTNGAFVLPLPEGNQDNGNFPEHGST